MKNLSSLLLWVLANAIIIKAQINICSVSSTLTDASGIITSPNYPSNYGNRLDCSATIAAAAGKVIRIQVLNMNIESSPTCNLDGLSIYDGESLFSSRVFCGTEIPRTFTAHNPTVRIRFTTDTSTTLSGFRIQWTTSDGCGDGSFTCWDGVCVPSTRRCDTIQHCYDDSDEMECAQTSTNHGECGKLAVAPQFLWDLRVVGGNNAASGNWPWQVLISVGCGGSVISNDWVVTAAHCNVAVGATVTVGLLDTTTTTGTQTLSVAQVVNHPDYNRSTLRNDISLLRLSTSIVYSSTARPICLPDDSSTFDIPAGTTCIATGWGTLASGSSTPNIMQQVRLPVVDQTQCSNAIQGGLIDSQMCTGDLTNGGVDTCQGDSGGPLVCYINEAQWFLLGITSFGDGCAQPGKPGVYTRVSKFATWIAQISGVNSASIPPTPVTATFPVTTTATTPGVTNDDCGVLVFTAASGNISSPGHPSNYPSSQSCQWTIQTTSDKVIEIRFLSFILESTGSSCAFDHLTVYDGTDIYTGVNFCGTTKPRNFAASSTSVRIVFVSDSSISAAGFLINWQTVDRCGNDEFACWSGDCILSSLQCNGARNCADDSDEITCAHASSSHNECGKVMTAPQFTWDHRVVGGNEAAAESWPWVAALLTLSGTTPFCGGSIVSTRWILTAAHCVDDSTPFFGDPNVKVEVGKHIRTGGASQSSTVSTIYTHSSYSSTTTGNDIALLRLTTELVYSSNVRPICIPSANHAVDSSSMAVATGWGTLRSGGDSPSVLYQVRLPVVTHSACNVKYPLYEITSSQVCAGDTANGGVDTCQGDSGGPLVSLVTETTWYLLGITSYGTGCADASSPGVYTRVSSFKTWIDDTMASGAAETKINLFMTISVTLSVLVTSRFI